MASWAPPLSFRGVLKLPELPGAGAEAPVPRTTRTLARDAAANPVVLHQRDPRERGQVPTLQRCLGPAYYPQGLKSSQRLGIAPAIVDRTDGQRTASAIKSTSAFRTGWTGW